MDLIKSKYKLSRYSSSSAFLQIPAGDGGAAGMERCAMRRGTKVRYAVAGQPVAGHAPDTVNPDGPDVRTR